MTEPPSERPPVAWPIAAGTLLIGLLVLVAAGLWFTRREQVPSASAPATAPRPAALPRAAATPAVLAAEAGAVARSQAVPTAVPTAVGVGHVPQSDPYVVAWWEAERPVEAGLSDQVLQAYNQFWQVRTQALFELDPSQIEQVTAGQVLDGERRAIEALRAQNRAQQVDIEHNARILYASADEAAVEDHYVSHTVLLDAASKAPIEPPPSTAWRLAYRLQKIDGVWKVVESVRVRYAQP
jgi:hypothetical protein